MAKMNKVRDILAIIVIREWQLDQLDIKNVFMNEILEEKVYMCMPSGYEKMKKYYKLKKPCMV